MKQEIWLRRLVSVGTFVLTASMGRMVLLNTLSMGGFFANRYATIWALVSFVVGAVLIAVVLIGLALERGRGVDWLPKLEQKLVGGGLMVALALLGLMLVGMYVLVYQAQPDRLTAALPRLWLLWMAALLSMPILKAWLRITSPAWAFWVSLMVWGGAFVVYSFVPQVNNFPFSLGWSEGSRFYNASMFFSEAVYGQRLPLPVLHPTRYAMQSLPFVLGNSPIWVHRLWQVLLWLGCTILGAWLLARRLQLESAWQRAALTLLGGLFLFQGPVYYHLMVCSYLVLAGFSKQKPWRTLILVLLSSVWAGLSRLNWYPMPGVLAALLYFLEVPLPDSGEGWLRRWLRYATWPVAWALGGTGLAFAVSKLYERLSGNPVQVFGSATESPLLWNRLWPNATYPLGILQAALLAVLPMVVAIILVLLKRAKGGERWHGLRLAGVAAILIVFLAGGMVVSVKVGGGSNLHNLDAFLLLELVVGVYIVWGRFEPDAGTTLAVRPGVFLVFALALIPTLWPVYSGASLYFSSPQTVLEERQTLQRILDEANQQPGPVLFISERQLLTFHLVQVREFEPEYEKVFLMEMAMAGNSFYLERFYDDLQHQRFSLIVAEPLNANLQDARYAFSEENNLWVERVELPILARYQLKEKINSTVSIYEPKR